LTLAVNVWSEIAFLPQALSRRGLGFGRRRRRGTRDVRARVDPESQLVEERREAVHAPAILELDGFAGQRTRIGRWG
jgi:hypothetical protein